MKKLVPISLLLIFLFNFFGYFPLFKFSRSIIREEIEQLSKRDIPEDQLCSIIVPINKLNELEWKEQGKEFRYNGAMYDIVKQKIEKGVITFYCINDKQEARLFAHIEELLAQQINNEKYPVGKTAKNIVKMFDAVKFFCDSKFIFNQYNTTTSFYCQYFFSCTTVFIEIPTPPPNTLA